VIVRVLNHVSGVEGGLVGVYQRHKYRPERKAVLDTWGAHIRAIVDTVPRERGRDPSRRRRRAN
jgi:hypothetical protein